MLRLILLINTCTLDIAVKIQLTVFLFVREPERPNEKPHFCAVTSKVTSITCWEVMAIQKRTLHRRNGSHGSMVIFVPAASF